MEFLFNPSSPPEQAGAEKTSTKELWFMVALTIPLARPGKHQDEPL
jgi:hypothetical protein